MSETDLTSIYNLICGWILCYRCAHLLKAALHTVGLYGPRHILSASVKDVFNINYLLHKEAPSTSLAPNFTDGQAVLQEVTPGHVLQRELLSWHSSNLHCHSTKRVMMCAENNYPGPRQRRRLLVSVCPTLFIYQCFPSLPQAWCRCERKQSAFDWLFHYLFNWSINLASVAYLCERVWMYNKMLITIKISSLCWKKSYLHKIASFFTLKCKLICACLECR